MSARTADFRLSKAPLVEALLEIHFNKTADYLAYGPVPGQMYERLRDSYPSALDLDAANLPLTFEGSSPIVRHRFSSEDAKRLFQVGNGVVTVNSVAYHTYGTFREQVERVALQAFRLLGEPTRAILRYINKISTDGQSLDRVLLVGLSLPALPGSSWARQQATCARPVPGLGEFQMTWACPVDERDDLVLLDLQVTSASFVNSSLERLLQWMDAAHREVEDAFFGCLTTQFLEGIQ